MGSGLPKIAVFIAGFAIMAAEMAAPRMLAPTFGASQLVWTNVIGTILVALTLGAWLGGRAADRFPDARSMSRALVAGGLCLLMVPLASTPLLRSTATALPQGEVGTLLGSLAIVSLLFAPPVLLLGMIAPWAIRLAGRDVDRLGKVAGALGACAALGSILGTFASSLILLPVLGTKATIAGSGFAICIAGVLGATDAWRWRAVIVALASLVMLGALMGKEKKRPGEVFRKESPYQLVRVMNESNGWRRLLVNEGLGYQSSRPPRGLITNGVWDYLSLTPSLLPGAADRPLRILILGLGAGTVAWQVDAAYAQERAVRQEGIELDPVVLEAGRRFFGLDEIPSLDVECADARAAIRARSGPYDVVILDAYRGTYIPFHLATREFFELVKERMPEDGLLAINVAAPVGSDRMQDALSATIGIVFPHVQSIGIGPNRFSFENTIYLASSSPIATDPKGVPKALQGVDLRPFRAMTNTPSRRVTAPWQDDRAPVEFVTNLSLLRLLGLRASNSPLHR